MSGADAGRAHATVSDRRRRWVLDDDAPVALAALGPDGRIARANRSFCHLVARSEGDLAGEPLARLLHEDDRAGHERELGRLQAGESSYRRDERYLRPDGTVVWVTNEVARDGDGRLLLVAHASDSLLARAHLARERAEADVRRRDEFLSVLSHELRSPLAAMMVWARLLRDVSYEGVDADRGLEVIERSGRTLERILDDLAHVSRISSGKLQLNSRCSLDLRTVAQSAVEALSADARAKGVRVSSSFPAEPVTVSGDPGRLQQAVTNILSNAIKFTPAEGWVELSLDLGENEAVLRVADSGEGMSDSFLPLAFERFRQGDTSTTRVHHGLGLGLYIVRHLVTLHGGRVSVASPGPGRGSVFTVRLPLEMPVASEPAPPCVSTHDVEVRSGLRVLIVDDDDDTREALRLILKQSGIQVETASSAPEAVEKVEASHPDVLLSDIAMPGEDGLALIRRVRSLAADRGGTVPAAALTAYASPAERDAALQAGFDWHVPKPVDPPELLQVIARLARRPR